MTNLQFGPEAREKILEGARKTSQAVGCTLGPAGRNVSIRRNSVEQEGTTYYLPPLITKDGVTVANNIESFDNIWEDMGLQMIKEAARNTNKTGDGTTTSTILAYEMMKGGLDLINQGSNAIHVRRGMEKAKDAICEHLEKSSIKVEGLEDLISVARISSQDDNLASVVANAIHEVGESGAVTMAMGIKPETYYEVASGMQIPTGYASSYFAKNGKCEIRDAYILVTHDKIASIRDLAPILDQIRNQLDQNEQTKDHPIKIAIFSTGVSGDALKTLAKNNQENPDQIQCVVLNPPYFGGRQKEALEDIAISTGATFLDQTAGRKVQEMKIVDLGTCDNIIASNGMTTIVGSHGSPTAIEDRIKMIKEILEKEEKDSEKDYLNSRIAGLEGKIANIYVGGSSQMEQREKMHRVEDAIASTKEAFISGILPGGGVAMLRSVLSLEGLSLSSEDEAKGVNIVKNALKTQLYHVSKNAGENPEEVIIKVIKMSAQEGFNAETREYGNMIEMKIVDPAKVPISALTNAVSVAASFLTLETAISNAK